jgi:hypothetical protein
MSIGTRLARFASKPRSDQLAAFKATVRSIFDMGSEAKERRRLYRILTGAHAPPRVLRAKEKLYLAYRPESDVIFSCYPEIAQLSEKWTKDNVHNNAGDLQRLYALILNIKQILDENIAGDMAELGVFRGNSAAVLAHYARLHGKKLLLFDTFEGFDRRDLVGVDDSPTPQFDDTSLDQVRDLVGDEAVRLSKADFLNRYRPILTGRGSPSSTSIAISTNPQRPAWNFSIPGYRRAGC